MSRLRISMALVCQLHLPGFCRRGMVRRSMRRLSPWQRIGFLERVLIAASILMGACADTHGSVNSTDAGAASHSECSSASFGWIELQGPQIGSNPRANQPESPIRVEVVDDDGFEVGPIFRTRGHPINSVNALLLQVTNRTMPLRCQVHATKTELRGHDGEVLTSRRFDRLIRTLYGSAGVQIGRDMPVVETSCLGPGETGYLELENVEGDPAEVSVSLRGDADFERPTGCVIARSYAVDDDRLSVVLANDGREPVVPRTTIALYLLLDEVGVPQQLGMVVGPNNDEIEPGARVTYEGPLTYDGTSRRLLTSYLY